MEVLLETNHGSYRLEAGPGETVRNVLERCRVPLSAVWTYVLDDRSLEAGTAGARRVRFVRCDARLDDPTLLERQVFARVTRNINLPALLGFDASTSRPIPDATTEWRYPGESGGAYAAVDAALTVDECLSITQASVDATLASWPADLPRRLVVGTSGGGDSNVLMSTLVSSPHIADSDIIPVMMLGIPDWDTQLENAKQVCEANGLRLHVIESEEAARLAGLKSFTSLKASFRDHYPDADLEFLGTWLLRKVLGAYAKSIGAEAVATGANREDIIAEGLARLCQGRAPLTAPFRRIGDTTFVFPIYRVPKKIGDGAYPTLSLENYEARNPSFSPGRSIYYYLAYQLADLVPGVDVTMLDGFARLADASPDPFEFDERVQDFVVSDLATESQRTRWASFLEANIA